MLHILNRSPYADAALLARLCEALTSQDTLLLIEDGVLGVTGAVAKRLAGLEATVVALSEDVIARGLDTRVHASVGLVDMQGFVRLTAEHASSVSWR